MNFEAADTYAAAIAAVFGGMGVKILEKLMSKRSEQFLEATKLRDELRTENSLLRAELEQRREEADAWRSRYYEQVEENLVLNQNSESFRLEIQRLKIRLNPNDVSTDEK